MAARDLVTCGWQDYPFWRCQDGPRFDLRLPPDDLRLGPLLPPHCPGCGGRLPPVGGRSSP